MWPGTGAVLALTVDDNVITTTGSLAQDGFNIVVTSEIPVYNLIFDVVGTFQDIKHRGPFKNDQNYCFKFHGSVDKWDIDQVSC